MSARLVCNTQVSAPGSLSAGRPRGCPAMRVRLPRPRLVAAGLVSLIAVFLLVTDPTHGQEKAASPAAPPPKDVLPFGPALLLPTADSGVSQKLQAAREYVAAKEWGEAARALQDLLDRPEDVFLSVPRRGPDGKDTTAAVS